MGIEGNEAADKLAKHRTSNRDEVLKCEVPIKDIKRIIKQIIVTKWNLEYPERSLLKGRFYSSIQIIPETTPWFKKFTEINSADTL